ncbi:unnamed protein product [Urochloa humidicola]
MTQDSDQGAARSSLPSGGRNVTDTPSSPMARRHDSRQRAHHRGDPPATRRLCHRPRLAPVLLQRLGLQGGAAPAAAAGGERPTGAPAPRRRDEPEDGQGR